MSHRSSPQLLRSTICAAALATVALTGGALTALAQPKPAPTAKPASRPPPAPSAPATSTGAPPPELIDGSEELQKLYLDGDAALKRSAFGEAENLFTKAWSLSKSFDIAAALGTAKLEVGKPREAAQYLSFALRNAVPSTRAAVRDRIKRDLDSARQKLASVKLTVSLTEAKIAIDGAPLDPIFLGPELFVDPGKRTFEASADGYVTAKSTLDTKAGEIYVVTLTLERTPPPGVPTATAPPPPQGTPLPAKIIGAAGGVGLIAGAIFVGVAESRKKDAYAFARMTLSADGKPTCPLKGPGPTEQCDKIRAATADMELFGNTGIGFFIGGGALLLAAGAVSLFYSPSEPAKKPDKQPAATSRIVPVIAPSAGGIVWTGSF